MDQLGPGSDCSFVEVMNVVGGKWRGTIIYCLGMGPRRFNELRREVTPITQKMLTQELRALERDGLVSRVHHAEIPPRVVYSLTELGLSLVSVFSLIKEWMPNMDAVAEARVGYDERQESDTRGESSDEST